MEEKQTSYRKMIEKFGKTIEQIDFAIQLQAFIAESIAPENLPTEIEVDGEKRKFQEWTHQPEVLKSDFAHFTKIAMVSYSVIVCWESYLCLFPENYFKKTLATRQDIQNSVLYDAQTIFRLVRNALGHMYAKCDEFEAKAIWNFGDGWNGIYDIKDINMTLDARELNGQQFEWKHVGGLESFKNLLNYLKEDLVVKAKTDEARRKVLDELAQEAQELGLY